MTVSGEAVWMTRAAFTKLQDELTQLTRADADDRDVSQVRIAELRDLIERAEIGIKPDDGLIEPGMTVTVRLDGDQPETFLLGDRELIGSSDSFTVYSPDSPLGRAICDRYVGDQVSYTAPNGNRIEVSILSASPYDQTS